MFKKSNMKIKILKKEEIDRVIAEEIITLINSKNKVVLGLATGSSPIGVYDLLVKAYQNKEVSFKNVISFNLDEYLNIDIENKQSYHYFMKEHLFSKVDIDINNTHFPSEENYLKYDEEIKQNDGIDYQILGIGSNGHIAFNEPGTMFNEKTHIVELKNSTIKDNSRFFSSIEEVPTKAITSGLETIMQARKIVLIATGKNKARAICDLIEKEKTTLLPASILKDHDNVVIYCDEDASSLLTKQIA